jgi:hypothetical protein
MTTGSCPQHPHHHRGDGASRTRADAADASLAATPPALSFGPSASSHLPLLITITQHATIPIAFAALPSCPLPHASQNRSTSKLTVDSPKKNSPKCIAAARAARPRRCGRSSRSCCSAASLCWPVGSCAQCPAPPISSTARRGSPRARSSTPSAGTPFGRARAASRVSFFWLSVGDGGVWRHATRPLRDAARAGDLSRRRHATQKERGPRLAQNLRLPLFFRTSYTPGKHSPRAPPSQWQWVQLRGSAGAARRGCSCARACRAGDS